MTLPSPLLPTALQAAPSTAGRCCSAPRARYASSVAARHHRRFDPVLARQLQHVLRGAHRDPSTHFPGAILHVNSPTLDAWTGVVGLGRIAPATPIRPADRFRAGSIMKPLVSVVVLQLAERGRLSLDAPLPHVLPARVAGRFADAASTSVRMLLATAAVSRTGSPQPSSTRSPIIPPRCGRSARSWISPPPSRRCSRPGLATRTRTPTTTCSA